jgi:hypothetical protein
MLKRKDKPPARRRAPDRFAEKELRRRERETRDDLADFVSSVLAVAADSADELGIAEAERTLRRKHAEHFSSSVKELIAILADHPHAPEREYWLFKLWQALGSVSFIANRWTERIEKRIKIESAARATAGKRKKTVEGDEVLIAAARPIWLLHATWKPWRVADKICEQIKDQLPTPLGQNAIAKRLKRLRSRILSAD